MNTDNNTTELNDILENILYWDTCPDEYKDRIKKHLKRSEGATPKGDYHEGLQEGIAIGRKEALKSSEWLVGVIDKTIMSVILDNDLNHGMSKYDYKDIVDILLQIKESIISTPTPETASEGEKWISVEDAKNDKTYLVWFLNEYGKKRVCKATYYGKFGVEASDDSEDYNNWEEWTDLDESTGVHYCPEGWYETNEYDEKQMQITCKVLGMMPLPLPPTQDKGEVVANAHSPNGSNKGKSE